MPKIESVIVVKYHDLMDKKGGAISGGYVATLRFDNYKLDRIFSSHTKDDLPSGSGIYQQVERYIKQVGAV